MAKMLLRGSRKHFFASLPKIFASNSYSFRPPVALRRTYSWWEWRNFSHGSVNLVISPQGKPKFETCEIEPPKKGKWKTKKRLKMQRKREKQKRKAANKRDLRRLRVKGKKKKQKFANAEERIKHKLENIQYLNRLPS